MSEHREVETKWSPEPDAAVPDLGGLPDVARTSAPRIHELVATYIDTTDLALARAGVSLRRRTGGEDDGWHLKVPEGRDRIEVRAPLGRAVRTPPVALRRAVVAWTRGAALSPVATIATLREVVDLLHEDGRVLAQLADDLVVGTPADGEAPVEWRQWELELMEGDAALLAAAEQLLAGLGVPVSASQLKLETVLGDRMPQPEDLGKPSPDEPAGGILHRRLKEQVAELFRRDSEVRRGVPDAVHQVRVACRRLRGALATFGPLVDPAITDPLRDELRWLAHSLGAARDAEVVHDRLRAMVAQEPSDLLVGPVRRRIDRTYATRARENNASVDAVLGSDRYLALLAGLDTLVAAPPWTHRADDSARDVALRRIRKDWKRLQRRVTTAQASTGVDELAAHDEALHAARKAAKRLRYSCEAVEPVWGKEARRLRKSAQHITRVLGERQDTVVSRHDLAAISSAAQAADESTFTYGRLHAREEALAETLQLEFDRVWRKASRSKVRAWLG